MPKRIARTIQDIADLLLDYNVEVNLMDDNRVEFLFPDTEEEIKHKGYAETFRIDDFSHLSETDPIHYTRKTRYIVRSLTDNPRFWRLTTVADQLARFRLGYNKQENKPYGIIKTRKRANENLCIVFESMEFAQNFVKDLEKTGFFENV